MTIRHLLLASATVAALGSTSLLARPWQNKADGFRDTPLLPGGKWHVHDSERPQPPVVTPGTASTPEAPGKAPSDAVVLFNGSDTSAWAANNGSACPWKVEDGSLVVAARTGPINTKQAFGDCQIHLEYATPKPTKGRGQGRGNSGLLIMGRYEVQILDCFENPTYADGTVGAVYGQTPPLANASRPPGEWQSLDVVFTAPRFKADGSVETPAYVTAFVNGVLTQNHTASLGPVVYRAVAHYEKHADREPIQLQDHGAPMRFRNIWVREVKSVEAP